MDQQGYYDDRGIWRPAQCHAQVYHGYVPVNNDAKPHDVFGTATSYTAPNRDFGLIEGPSQQSFVSPTLNTNDFSSVEPQTPQRSFDRSGNNNIHQNTLYGSRLRQTIFPTQAAGTINSSYRRGDQTFDRQDYLNNYGSANFNQGLHGHGGMQVNSGMANQFQTQFPTNHFGQVASSGDLKVPPQTPKQFSRNSLSQPSNHVSPYGTQQFHHGRSNADSFNTSPPNGQIPSKDYHRAATDAQGYGNSMVHNSVPSSAATSIDLSVINTASPGAQGNMQARVNQTADAQGAQDAKAKDAVSLSQPALHPNVTTVDEASKYLTGKGLGKKAYTILKIKVQQDDFDQVKIAELHYAQKILHAVLMKPTSTPGVVAARLRTSWWEKQNTALKNCQKKFQEKLTSSDGHARASSLALIVVNEAVMLHAEGLSTMFLKENSVKKVKQDGTVSGEGNLKTRTEYIINRAIKCSARIDKVVKAVTDNKQVALDVLGGELLDIKDLVRAPDAYTDKKLQYFKVNMTRKSMLDDGKAYRKEKYDGKTAEAATPAETKKEKDDGEPTEDAEESGDDRYD